MRFKNTEIKIFYSGLKLFLAATLILAVCVLCTGCSVVFTCSMTGSIVDAEDYKNDEANSGIADASVYLYTEEDAFKEDLAAWQENNALTPNNPAEGEPKYFIATTTDNSGDFTFNGLIWNEYFSEYGKSGDRKEVFLLFYHKNYGLCSNPTPVYVVSDVTNRLSVIELDKILNTAELSGKVFDEETEQSLAYATVNIWVPESWEYNSDGSINTSSGLTWSNNPSYSVVTDADGDWSREITYKMLPSSADNTGTTIVRLTFSIGGYLAENSADADIIDGGWDIDGSGTIDKDEDDGYYQPTVIEKDSYNVLNDIYLANEFNTAVISGTVEDSAGNNVANVTVEIYVPESWTYSDATNPESINSLTWPENPVYTLLTDANGEYSQNIEFDRLPSVENNLETTKVRLVFSRDNYMINNNSDSDLIDQDTTPWDINQDGNTTDEPSYYESGYIYNDKNIEFDDITIKATRFDENLSGQVVSDAATPTGLNGVEVWLFFDQSSAVNGDSPDFIQTTSTTVFTTNEIEKGYFEFANLSWTDTDYTGNQSRIDCILYLPAAAEITSGTYNGAGSSTSYKLTSGADNQVSLKKS